MPTRMLREGILTSETVNSLSEPAELFYRRLMSVVDDFGRFYAKPALLRSRCYPLKLDKVSDLDIVKFLAEVCNTKGPDDQLCPLVEVYEVAGKQYLQVLNFKQQVRAKKSLFPDPSANAQQTLRTCAASVYLDVDVVEDEGVDVIPADAGIRKVPEILPSHIPYKELVALFNEHMVALPKVRDMTPKRRQLIRAAWQAHKRRQTLDFWQKYFEECAEDPFLNGTGPYRPPHDNWRPTFDFLLRSDQVTKVYERAMQEAGSGR